nr:MAG TPA: hypothetical protein [Caudoviricetes sp.]
MKPAQAVWDWTVYRKAVLKLLRSAHRIVLKTSGLIHPLTAETTEKAG